MNDNNYTSLLFNGDLNDISTDLQAAINNLAMRLDNQYDHRPLTINNIEEIKRIVRDEIILNIPVAPVLPAPDAIVSELKRSVLNFKLVE